MHISSQLATAAVPSASRSATSAPDHAAGFHEALQAAATNNGAAAPASDTKAGRSLPQAGSEMPGQSLVASTSKLVGTVAGAAADAADAKDTAETAETAETALTAQAPAGQVTNKKGKATSSSAGGTDDSAGSGSAVLATSTGTAALALPVASADPLPSALATQETAGTDASAATGDAVLSPPGSPGGNLPPLPAGDQGSSSRFAPGAAGDAPGPRSTSTASDGPTSSADAKTAETASSALLAFPTAATNGTEQNAALAAAAAGRPAATPQTDALPLGTMSAGGKDRTSAGEVRGKRKDTSANATGPERTSANVAPSPFAAKLVEAQAPAQAAPNDARGGDPAALQKALDGSQAIPSTGASGFAQTTSTSATPAPTTAATPDAAATAADGPVESSVVPGVSSAQLIQSAGQTEMRMGMRSAEFGNISISTSVSHQAISAQISLDHAELGRALAMHLPAIEEKLGTAYGLHARVEMRDDSGASQSATDPRQQGGGSQEQTSGTRGGSRSGASLSAAGEVTGVETGAASLPMSSSASAAPAERSRLDIRI